MSVWFIDVLESLFHAFAWILNYPYQLFGGLVLLGLRPWTWLAAAPSLSPAYVKNLTPEVPKPAIPEPATFDSIALELAPEAAPAPAQEPEKLNNPCVLYQSQ